MDAIVTFLKDPNHLWLVIGLFGQALFFMRFIVQWLASERARQSVIPHAFWYFSIAGGAVLLAYSIWRQDLVFILGQAFGMLIYSRNLYFTWIPHAPGRNGKKHETHHPDPLPE